MPPIDDERIMSEIERLAEERQALEEAASAGPLEPAARNRLDDLTVVLDELWDLLRQRRALRDAGRDPDGATLRNPETVEHYLQ